MRIVLAVLWLAALGGSCVGGVTLFGTLGDDSAPRIAAGAASACAWAVLPYVFARGVDAIRKLNAEDSPSWPPGSPACCARGLPGRERPATPPKPTAWTQRTWRCCEPRQRCNG